MESKYFFNRMIINNIEFIHAGNDSNGLYREITDFKNFLTKKELAGLGEYESSNKKLYELAKARAHWAGWKVFNNKLLQGYFIIQKQNLNVNNIIQSKKTIKSI